MSNIITVNSQKGRELVAVVFNGYIYTEFVTTYSYNGNTQHTQKINVYQNHFDKAPSNYNLRTGFRSLKELLNEREDEGATPVYKGDIVNIQF